MAPHLGGGRVKISGRFAGSSLRTGPRAARRAAAPVTLAGAVDVPGTVPAAVVRGRPISCTVGARALRP